MERCRVYYKGEGGGFPQVRVVVNYVCPCRPWLILAPKVFQIRTNHLVWVLCGPMWVNEACQLFLVPSRSSSTPLYPSKCCELRNMPQLLLLPLFSTWTHIWVFQGVGSASLSMAFVSIILTSSYKSKDLPYFQKSHLMIGALHDNMGKKKHKFSCCCRHMTMESCNAFIIK